MEKEIVLYCTAEQWFKGYPFQFIRIKHRQYIQDMHYHDYVQIWYVKKGQCLHYLNGKEYKLSKGDIFILPPMMKHKIVSEDMENTELLECGFLEEFISKNKDGIIHWSVWCQGIRGYITTWFNGISFQYASSAAVIKRADFQSYKDWQNAVKEHYSANYWKKSSAWYDFLCPLCNVDKCQGDCSKQQAVFAEQIKKINTKNMQN